MNIETDDNDFKGVFGNGQWELNVLMTCSGFCDHETLLEHVITIRDVVHRDREESKAPQRSHSGERHRSPVQNL